MNPKKQYFAPMHTAEHILNQTMMRLFKCERSFSNHIERKKSKCDYHFSRELSSSELVALENLVNEVIGKNLVVTCEVYPIEEAREQFQLSRLPENPGDSLRMVFVGDYDICPCIGDHVASTGEIGNFKIVSSSFNEGVLRIRYKLQNS